MPSRAISNRDLPSRGAEPARLFALVAILLSCTRAQHDLSLAPLSSPATSRSRVCAHRPHRSMQTRIGANGKKQYNCRCSKCLDQAPGEGRWYSSRSTPSQHLREESQRLALAHAVESGPSVAELEAVAVGAVSGPSSLGAAARLPGSPLDQHARADPASSASDPVREHADLEDVHMQDAFAPFSQSPDAFDAALAAGFESEPSLFSSSSDDEDPAVDVDFGTHGMEREPSSSAQVCMRLRSPSETLKQCAFQDPLPDQSVPRASASAPATEAPVQSAAADQIKLEHLKYAHEFIEALKTSTLEDGGLSPESIRRLLNPEQAPLVIDDPDVEFSLELFMALSGSAQHAYRDAREAILRRRPAHKVLSYEQCEQEMARLTGIYPTEYDMCINSCAAFVRPWKDRTHCIECGHPRYDEAKSQGDVRVPYQRLVHNPPALQIQAMLRSPVTSKAAKYRAQATDRLVQQLGPDGIPDKFEDFISGQAYLDAVRDGRITRDSIVVAGAMDGAQLYASKESDCWFLIWIVFEIGDDMRYKKKYLIVDTIIPGKHKPVHMYSFMFVTLQNIAALMRMNDGKGMPMWSAADERLFLAKFFMAFNLADAPGMATVNGLVGHTGARGCRLFCEMRGRRKPGGTTYYPALLRPHNYNVVGCTHESIDPAQIRLGSAQAYKEDLECVEHSKTQAEYERERKRTGISKRSIFEGLPAQNRLSIPGMFPLDLMHILCLNLAMLLMELWTGTINCDDTDDKAKWPWAVLRGNVWKDHGARVAELRSRIPGSHDIAPRNIAEKLNSNYKAKEHQTHLYVLCPGLLWGVLPFVYWQHFCKLARAVRILHQKSIKRHLLDYAHELLLEFVLEFEVLYVQFRWDRLHFVRPAVHTLVHMVPETYHIGTLSTVSQWAMERAIGLLTDQIRQDSNPYRNLAFQALRMVQANALKSMVPRIDAEARRSSAARSGCFFANRYALLPLQERTAHTLERADTMAIEVFVVAQGGSWPTKKVRRWARAQLPNGQSVRSLWKEETGSYNWRAASCVRVSVLFHYRISISALTKVHRSNMVAAQCLRVCDTSHFYRQLTITKSLQRSSCLTERSFSISTMRPSVHWRHAILQIASA
jgi:hypothetical protein